VRAAAIAAVVATGINLAIEELARAAFAVSPEFEPFQGTVAPYTVGGVVLAAIAFWAVSRMFRHVARAYTRVSIAALLLSWIPDVGLLVVHDPGATVPAVASLMLMHAVTAIIVVALLLRLGQRTS
jgi:hypothetical protein